MYLILVLIVFRVQFMRDRLTTRSLGQSRILSDLTFVHYLKTKRILYGLMVAPTGGKGQKMELHVCTHILDKKAYL